MNSQGYVYILNAKYVFFRSALDFYLIPANEDDRVNYALLSDIPKTLIPYKESVYSNSHILVDEIYPGEDNSLKLKAKCCIFRGGGAACPAWREPRVRTRRSHPFELV